MYIGHIRNQRYELSYAYGLGTLVVFIAQLGVVLRIPALLCYLNLDVESLNITHLVQNTIRGFTMFLMGVW